MEEYKGLDDLGIIILNYNSSIDVKRQIQSLRQEGMPSSAFYILDNNSADQEKLYNICRHENLFFHQMKSNLGYAHANNWGIKKALEDGKKFFLILNPDIDIDLSCIQSLYIELISDSSLAVIGPRIMYNNDKSLIFSDGGLLYPKKGFKGDHVNYQKKVDTTSLTGLNFNIDYVNGSAMMFRKEVVEDIGFMYEHLFMYYEESEWCYRIKKSNKWRIAINTAIQAYQTDSSRNEIYEYYMTRNRIWFSRKYNGNTLSAVKDRLNTIKQVIISRELDFIQKRSFIRKIVSGIIDGFKLAL